MRFISPKNEVIAHLFKFDFVAKRQQGLLAKHSIVTQMFDCVNYWNFTFNIGH